MIIKRFGSDLGGVLTDALAPVLDQEVQSVAVQTTLLPDIVIDHPFAISDGQSAAQGQDTSWLVKLLKPQVTVQTSSGPVVVAPWGAPSPHWGLVQIGALLLLSLVVLDSVEVVHSLFRGGR